MIIFFIFIIYFLVIFLIVILIFFMGPISLFFSFTSCFLLLWN